MSMSIMEAAYTATLKTKVGREITGETIRIRAQEMGVTAKVPGEWGSVVQRLISSGLLQKTNKTIPSVSPTSHGRRVPVYIRCKADRKKILG